MHKSLIVTLSLALGLSASAYAANPFADVPAGHWAYGSIAKLAAAGVIDGYPDGSFQGDKLMTRYEMAQIVARAMAKGANVNRLASEFADELDALGVRVTKLEKESDNVKLTGELRYHYKNINDTNKDGSKSPDYEHNLRSRIWFTGAVNDDWNYVGMLENNHSLKHDDTNSYAKIISSNGDDGGENTHFQRAYLEGRLGGLNVSAGRQDFTIADGNLWDNQYDGINLAYGSKVKLSGFYGRPTNDEDFLYDKFWGVNVAGSVGQLDLNAGYTKFTNSKAAVADLDEDFAAGLTAQGAQNNDVLNNNGILNVGAVYNFGDIATLGAVYLKSNLDTSYSTSGWVATATYKGAEADRPHSYGFVAKYYNQGAGTAINHTMDGHYYLEGTKGYSLGANYTFAKNIVGNAVWYDTKSKETDAKSQVIWTELDFTF